MKRIQAFLRLVFTLQVFILLVSGTIPAVFGQTPAQRPTPRTSQRQNEETLRRAEEQKINQTFEDLRKLEVSARTSQRISEKVSRTSFRHSPAESEKLRPNAEDLSRYKSFLNGKRTGIFRLFPDFGCETKYTIRTDGNCGNSIAFSWSFSFLRDEYGDGNFFDIRLENERITADGFLTQNILVSLGAIPLEDVTLSSMGVKYLLEFKPEVNRKNAQDQFWQVANTIVVDGFSYGKAVIPKENFTYLARIIAYRISDDKVIKIRYHGANSIEEKRILEANNDNSRRDKIIAFRIIRMESDGSITVLWKELADRKSPKLDF